MKVSVIDLGYNSLKLVSYSVRQDNNSFFAYEQRSLHTRLGEGLDQTGFLSSEPIRRTIQGLKQFKDILEIESIKQALPVATSAVREAANGEEFMKRVHDETGFLFRVLSGKEEAIYSYHGGTGAIEARDVFFFDIGGGSLEVVYAENNRIKKILSLPLGGLRLTQLYADPDGTFSGKQYKKMRRRINELLPSREELGLSHDTVLLGVGGTVRAVATYDQARRDYPLYKLHNYLLARNSVEKIHRQLESMPLPEIGEIPCIGRDRAETIVAGSCVIEVLMQKLGLSNLTVSTHGLRDGVLSAFLENPLAYHRGGVRRRRLPVRQRKFKLQYSRSFVDALVRHKMLELKERSILEYSLNRLLMQSEPARPLPLFYQTVDEESILSHKDQLIASLSIVNGIQPKTANWLFEKYHQLLKLKHKRVVKKISALLLVIEVLERSRTLAKVRIREGNRIDLAISPEQASNGFPATLMSQLVTDLGKYLDYPTTLKATQSMASRPTFLSPTE